MKYCELVEAAFGNEDLVLQGKAPIKDGFGLQSLLIDMGWKLNKKGSTRMTSRYEGKVGQVKLSVLVDFLFPSARISPISAPKVVEFSRIGEFLRAASADINYGQMHRGDFEKKLKEVAKIANSFRAKKKTDVSGVSWGDLNGDAAIAGWKKRVEQIITDEYVGNTYVQERGVDLGLVYDDVMNNQRNGRIEGLTRQQVRQRLAAIMDAFVRAGRLEKVGSRWYAVAAR